MSCWRSWVLLSLSLQFVLPLLGFRFIHLFCGHGYRSVLNIFIYFWSLNVCGDSVTQVMVIPTAWFLVFGLALCY